MQILKYCLVLFLFYITIGIGLSQTKSVAELEQELSSAKTDSARGSICNKISNKWLNKDNQKAELYANKALDFFKNAEFPKGQGIALQRLGFIYMYTGENEKGYTSAKNSIEVLRQNGFYEESLPSYSVASYCLEVDGRFDDALKLMLSCLDMIDEKGISDKLKARNLVDLGRIYRQTNQFGRAVDTYEEALQVAQKEEDHGSAGIILINLSNVYSQTDDALKALEILKRAIPEFRKSNEIDRVNLLWRNIGFTYFELGQKEELKQALDSAEKTLMDKSNVQATIDIDLLKGCFSQIHGNHEDAVIHFEKAFTIAKENNYEAKIIQISTRLAESYAALGNQDKLAIVLETALELNDSIYSKEMASSIAEIQIKYETEKKEQALELANKENLLKEEFIKKVKTRNSLLIALLFVTLFLAGGAFYLFKKNQKSGALISDKNTELQLLIDQKSLLLKEIHHRVKNNLQTVSSLLSLQTRGSKDETVKKAIGVGQSRLKSISLLHQKLYKKDALEKVEMEEYIEDLSSYIIKNFNYQDKNIELKTVAENVALDLDTAIPIGLIINELITNSIKHSFGDIKDCFINVEIKKGAIDKEYELEIVTNGQGLPADFDIEKLSSTGLKLVRNLSRQLQGSFRTYQDKTAHFIVNFKEEIG